MADPKRGRETSEKVLPRREDEGVRRQTERQGKSDPTRHEKGGPGRESDREARPM
jgi:hypothetical protein